MHDVDLNRGETPERVEFENLSGGEEVEGGERVIVSEMDEDEWTDRNFGASAAEGSSDELSDLRSVTSNGVKLNYCLMVFVKKLELKST
ncbi:hypothetical protein LSTR_LSTR017288 [Laodelphax striatellus]|uniref:Uncharacterized protein n=1 Tax=Laodelphax striatellus TaxID=195883 RepID=A0A482X1I6_LAOST|nr:hypothetical protein LSTR_LSTR017288 [Laodelphax striatellus]